MIEQAVFGSLIVVCAFYIAYGIYLIKEFAVEQWQDWSVKNVHSKS